MLESTTAFTMRSLPWTIGAPQITELLLTATLLLIIIGGQALLSLAGNPIEGGKYTTNNSNMITSILTAIVLWVLIWWAGCFDKPGNWALWVLGAGTLINVLTTAVQTGKTVTVGSGLVLFSIKAAILHQALLFFAGFYTAVVPLPW